MLLTHRLFLLILISTSALRATTDEIPTVSMATLTVTRVLSSTNSTSDSSPINDTSTATDAAVTSIPSGNTTAPFPNNATTPLLSTHSGNVTSPPLSTQGNVTSSSTSAPVNATSSSVTTSGNTTTSPALVTTAANTTSPLVPTAGNATNHPVTEPGNTTTTPLPDPGNNTTLPQTTRGNDITSLISTPGNSTASPITTPSNVTMTAQTTSATCPSVPCPPLSVCVNSTCQCLTGTILLNNACVETKTFPSSLKVQRQYEIAMNDSQSPVFRKTADEIILAVNQVLSDQTGYINSTVLRLTPGSIVASVNSYFEPKSPITLERFTSTIETAIENATQCGVDCGILFEAQFNVSNLCEQTPAPCDVSTTVCEAKDGLAFCTCKPGHVPSPYEAKSCRVCSSGYKAQGNNCVPCSFGYSGFNCDDSSLLALVVVACVLGGLLLIVILAVLIYICMNHSRRKSNDSQNNSPYPAEEFQGTWSSQDISHIPRVTLTSTSSNDAFGNNLEMVEGPGKKGQSNGMRGSYDLRTDGMRTFKDPSPTRYSYLVGHENPYFLQGDEKR